MIVVIDYNVGNVKSVCNALRFINCSVKLSCAPHDIENADGIILPGVAAFGYAMTSLGKTAEVIKRAVDHGKPLLGICVGFQLLFETSLEYGIHTGLGLIKGNVIPLPAGQTIPHMGWNLVHQPGSMDIFTGLGIQNHFYFAHSYYADVKDSGAEVATTEYGIEIPASVQKKNVYGMQFHPEKSGPAGLAILKNFEKICKRETQC